MTPTPAHPSHVWDPVRGVMGSWRIECRRCWVDQREAKAAEPCPKAPKEAA